MMKQPEMRNVILPAMLSAATAAAHAAAYETSATTHPAGTQLPGILTGIALFLLLETAVIYLTFRPWFHNPNLPSPLPERYFHAAIYSFVAMVVTGAILTFTFAKPDLATTPLMAYYGYNNVCVVFDNPPSTYICPVYWFFAAYLIVRYAVEDTKRLVRLTSIGPGEKAAAYSVNVILVLVAAFFSLCLAIRPELDMKGHTLPFVALILILPVVSLMHCIQCRERSGIYLAGVGVYLVLSFSKAIFDIYALTSGSHVPPPIAQTVDFLWLACALGAPFLVPAPALSAALATA
jgi:hypothetical protein